LAPSPVTNLVQRGESLSESQHAVQAPIQVDLGGGCGKLGITVENRLHDEKVFLGGSAQPRRIVAGDPADAHQVRAKVAERGHEVGFPPAESMARSRRATRS
jgi:hypothetical protein